ncbi:hypothetical protein LCGC14_1770480 [marine sediment metagenome]|uniref:Uncharacterized protein n=1 Tax=marine sediment metagenome TaxID=412755 RepID=A0A0F9GYG8_9ZZZZ
MTTLYELERSIRAEVQEKAEELKEATYPEDLITEMVDGWVPIYNGQILEVAADSMDMAILEPELGPAFDGTPTPINIIAANIYETLQVAAFDEWDDIANASTEVIIGSVRKVNYELDAIDAG